MVGTMTINEHGYGDDEGGGVCDILPVVSGACMACRTRSFLAGNPCFITTDALNR